MGDGCMMVGAGVLGDALIFIPVQVQVLQYTCTIRTVHVYSEYMYVYYLPVGSMDYSSTLYVHVYGHINTSNVSRYRYGCTSACARVWTTMLEYRYCNSSCSSNIQYSYRQYQYWYQCMT